MALLYEFRQYETPGLSQAGGVQNEWLLTDAEQAVDFGGRTFEPSTAIKASDIELSSERTSGEISVQVLRENAIATLYAKGFPARPVWLRLIDSETGLTAFKGKVKSVAWSEASATLNVGPVGDLFQREGLRLRYQGPCGWALYSTRCGVDRAAHLVAGSLSAAPSSDGRTLTSPAFATQPDGWFKAGDFECRGQSRTIIEHSGDTITLMAAIDGLQAGDAFEATEGCDRSDSATGCAKFNNLARFGGCKNVPRKNPFEGLE